jgi:3-oxoacyl-(acyl-carrier-protein) synthase
MADLADRLAHLSEAQRTLFNLRLEARRERVEPIAIIGMACRFPGAESLDAFWQLLKDGVDAITEVPPARWDADLLYDPDSQAPGKMNTRWGGFVDGLDSFDADFFGISPREAIHIDPQQRLLLEVAWEALEDAGLVADRLAGSLTGVFVGIFMDDYRRLQLADRRNLDSHSGPGSVFCIAANRLSYLLDLRGPSMAIDTACSSSLVAVHLACQSLLNGEATLAIAGGVNAILVPEPTIEMTKAGLTSPDGRCKTFDASANGYVRSEGAGIVVLKPLSRAQADGDPIYAVIRGSAQPGWAYQRHHVAEPFRTGGHPAGGLRPRQSESDPSPVRGSARYRHGGGRRHRVPGSGRGARQRPPRLATADHRQRQDQHRTPRDGGRCGQPDQGRASPQEPGDPGEPAFQRSQPQRTVRGLAPQGPDGLRPLAGVE